MTKLFKEDGVYNFYLEMNVPVSKVEVTTANGEWTDSKVHAWRAVGALSGDQNDMKGMRDAVEKMSKAELQEELFRVMSGGPPGFIRQPRA